ncbi:putative signal transducing protein [Salinimicrobium sp. HB62]|uniref:putative signal transducing protein n=1 Tax=Salinimicrobium sp. HB62 TaxID=3077781 RepID=UPI002D777541|nr:DUF2007 domain-containing protein [Salinimicrobium sp. HB62]
MDYVTIYSTKDGNEIAVLKRVYNEEGIDYRIEDADHTGEVKRLQVAEKDKSKARELLDQTGFLTASQAHVPVRRRMAGKRWIFVFLAAFLLIIVVVVILMFMNVE